MTSATAFSAPYVPFTMELTAEEVTPPASSWPRLMRAYLGRCSNTMAFRIAVPPLAIWAVLYSMVEYVM